MTGRLVRCAFRARRPPRARPHDRLLRTAVAGLLALLCVPSVHAGDYQDGLPPRINYLLHCGGCHLPDGTGSPPEVPSLHGEIGALAALPEGRRYLARVPGSTSRSWRWLGVSAAPLER